MRAFAIVLLCLPVVGAHHDRLDYWGDDPFLTGGTKSVAIYPVGRVQLRPDGLGDFPKVMRAEIDLQKYPNGVTSFKILGDRTTYLLRGKKFSITIWPNLLRIEQDLTQGRNIVRIYSQQGFSRRDYPNPLGDFAGALDFINARPERIFLKNGLWKKEILCPGDCSFVLGARPAGKPKP